MQVATQGLLFKSQLRGKRLIGELHLTEEQFHALTKMLRAETRRELHRHPHLLAVALVFAGVYAYRQGNFWNCVSEHLPAVREDREAWAEAFHHVVRADRLEAFEDFPATATRNVSRILAHGGVPNYCLSDYFSLVRLATARPEWLGLGPRELIAQWVRPDPVFAQCDVPVQRFLTHGGAVAEDFLQRTLDLMQAAQAMGLVPSADEAGLPPRVVAAFADWQQANPTTTRNGTEARIRPPVVRYDPWQPDGLVLELPPHPPDMPVGTWSITAAQEATTLRTRPALTRAVLDTPALRYSVALRAGDNVTGAWTFAGIGTEVPLLAFDIESGKLLPWLGTLPPRPLAVIAPTAYGEPTDDAGGSLVRETFPALVAGWQGYRGYAVDLTHAQAVVLPSALGGPSFRVPVRDDSRDALRPTSDLAALALPGIVAGVERSPVVPSAPVVSIPIPTDSDAEETRSLWAVQVTSLDDTDTLPRNRPLATLAHTEDATTRCLVVPLAQKALLPGDVCGRYLVALRGPLGRDARFAFALVPGLTRSGADTPVVRTGAAPATATLRLHTSVPVAVRSHSEGVRVTPTSGRHTFNVTARSPEFEVAVVPHGEGAAVPLAVRVPWARWALQGMPPTGEVRSQDTPIAVDHGALMAAAHPALRLDGLALSAPGERHRKGGHAVVTLLGQRREATVHRGTALIALDTFRDTIRAARAAALTFTLDVWDTTGRHVVVRHPVVYMTQTLRVCDLRVSDSLTEAGERRISVHWREATPIAGRRLRFWRLAEPWREPFTSGSIPDDASGMWAFTVPVTDLPHALPPGPYRVEMFVAAPSTKTAGAERDDAGAWDDWDDWDDTGDAHNGDDDASPPALPPPPTTGGEGTVCDVVFGDAIERAAYADTRPDSAEGLLTRFLLTMRAAHLDRLPGVLAAGDALPALRVLLALLARERGGTTLELATRTAMETLREAITAHPGCAAALATLAGERETGETEGQFAHLCAALGLAQAGVYTLRDMLRSLDAVERDVLAAREPVFVLAIPPVEADNYDGTATPHPLATLCGAERLAVLRTVPFDSLPDLDPVGMHRIMQRRRPGTLSAENGSFVANSDATADVLKQRLRLFVEPPAYLFDAATVRTAMLAWLIRLKDDHNAGLRGCVRAWCNDEYQFCRDAHARFAGPATVTRRLAAGKLLTWRVPDPGWAATGAMRTRWYDSTSDLWMLRVPFLVGVAALVQRLHARRHPLHEKHPFSATARWIDIGRVAALAAPALWHHDLCLFDVLLNEEG